MDPMHSVNGVSFSDLVGKTLTDIETIKDGNDIVELKFICDDGSVYLMWHCQDCCETVYLEDMNGELRDLIGSPIIQAEESVSSDEDVEGYAYRDDSHTWTFYRMATKNGWVVLRWLGESNGYYSEVMNFDILKGPGVKYSAKCKSSARKWHGCETIFSDEFGVPIECSSLEELVVLLRKRGWAVEVFHGFDRIREPEYGDVSWIYPVCPDCLVEERGRVGFCTGVTGGF